MIKKISVLIVMFSMSNLFSQEFFIQSGKNHTSYEFASPTVDSNLEYRSAIGDAFAFGYNHKFNQSNFAYQVSVTYNQYNAAASNGATNYTWNTSYMGLQNTVSYSLRDKIKKIQIFLNAGFNTATVLRGDQFINTLYYDLKNQDEFSGIILQPLVGLNMQYTISDKIKLSLGYNFSKSFHISNSTDEKVSFLTNQIQLGLHFPIK
ncbi:hypothetical protein [uncultured Flavobacterium sp.]|jgi:hypothetical protein|uniref:hypothetical protein n=1 Tax=uncultured Flavobacterium sp. TaxID=165435 RepID=UPI0030CA2AC3